MAAATTEPVTGAKIISLRLRVFRLVFIITSFFGFLFCLLQHDSVLFPVVFSFALFWCLSHLGFSGSTKKPAQIAWLLWFSLSMGNIATLTIDMFVPQSRQFFQLDHLQQVFDKHHRSSHHQQLQVGNERRGDAAPCVDVFRGARHVALLKQEQQQQQQQNREIRNTLIVRGGCVGGAISSLQLYRRRGSLDGAGVDVVGEIVISGDAFELSNVQASALIVASRHVSLRNVIINGNTSHLRLMPSTRLENVKLRINKTASLIVDTVVVMPTESPSRKGSSSSSSSSNGGVIRTLQMRCRWFGEETGTVSASSLCDKEIEENLFVMASSASLHTRQRTCATFPQRVATALPLGVGWIQDTAHTLFPLASAFISDVIVPNSKIAFRAAAQVGAEIACGLIDAHRFHKNEAAATTSSSSSASAAAAYGEAMMEQQQQQQHQDDDVAAGSGRSRTEENFVCAGIVDTLVNSTSSSSSSSATASSDRGFPLVVVAYDSGLRSIVRDLSIVLSYIAGSVVWRVVVWCWEQERIAAAHLALFLWRCLVAGTNVTIAAAFWLAANGAVAAQMVAPHLLAAFHALVVPVALLSSEWALALCAWSARAYACYVATWMVLTMHIYAALMTPLKFALVGSVKVAWLLWRWGYALVFMISMRVHLLVFVLQSVALVFVTWHSIPGLSGAAATTNSVGVVSAGVAAALPATTLQLVASSIFGSRVISLLNWSIISRLAQHGYALSTALASYAKTNLTLLLVIFALRMIPIIGHLCVPLEVFVFPIQSALSFADAIQVGSMMSSSSSSHAATTTTGTGTALRRRRQHRLSQSHQLSNRHHHHHSSSDDEGVDGFSSSSAAVAIGGHGGANGGGVVTRSGLMRAIAALVGKATSSAEHQQAVMNYAERILFGRGSSGGGVLFFLWKFLTGSRYNAVVIRYGIALLVQLVFGDIIDFVFWIVPWLLFFAVCYFVWKVQTFFKGAASTTASAAATGAPPPVAASVSALPASTPTST